MKRVYIQAFAHKNLGDDLFVRMLCTRYPEVKFYISCSRFADDAFENIPNLVIMNRNHLKGMIIQNIKRFIRKINIDINFPFDAQVYIGGSIFIEPPNNSEICKYQHEIYQYKLSKNLPYFIIGANFGPYNHLKFVNIHHDFFKKEVNDVCFRDKQSYQLFSSLDNVRFAPDVICGIEMPKVDKKNTILISCLYHDTREGIINFSNQEFIQKTTEICQKYLMMGKEICLLSMCDEQKDYITCQAIQKNLDGKAKVISYNGNIDDILILFAQSEYIIAARFHAMILAWIAKVPVFPLVYSNKTQQVIEDYQFKGAFTDICKYNNLNFSQIDLNRKNQYIFDIDPFIKESSRQFLALDLFLEEGE